MKTRECAVETAGGSRRWMLLAKPMLGGWRTVRDSNGGPLVFSDPVKLCNARTWLESRGRRGLRRMGWTLDAPGCGEGRERLRVAAAMMAVAVALAALLTASCGVCPGCWE